MGIAIGFGCRLAAHKNERPSRFHAYGPISVGVEVSMRRINFFCLWPFRGRVRSTPVTELKSQMEDPILHPTILPTPCHDFSLAHCALLTYHK